MERPSAIPDNLKARLRDSYNAIAEKYTVWATNNADIRLAYLDKLLALLSSTHSEILELGCGAGIPTTEKLLAHSANFHVTGNDISSVQIALGKARLETVVFGTDRVKWIEGDMMDLDFAGGSYDVVLGFYTIQHLPREEQITVLGRIVHWLRPGGYILINLPADEEENVVMEGWMAPEGWVYYSGWSVEKYRQLLKGLKLDVVLDEVQKDNVKAEFLWIIAKKPEA
ncbi:hypothetical protein N0V93_003166 [Gnomoniopsis smithogilvyi]|uniref:Methyltransferase domain-containing protein n=1 Tax=Gnomoniopsis smithogilvyi TaxID=1191159 RepID=A0A9W8YW60_9PEZI|nr:hypothetical protein N0V93_003166 [Gnomoniopsis smithogilvyi]